MNNLQNQKQGEFSRETLKGQLVMSFPEEHIIVIECCTFE